MNHDLGHFKRASTGKATAALIPPRAPPLPAPNPRPLQRARDAASRFLGYASRPPSPQSVQDEDRFSHGSSQFMRSASLGASQNATTSHKTGLEIKTLSINESGTHAIIAGKEIFKTVRIEDGHCAEDLNLRSKIRSTPNHASGQPRQIYSIDIADVAWAKGNTGHYVAAATSSGKIIVYDLGHAGLQAAQLIEHQRQVHNVTFSPHSGSLLLSGSQDGTVRLWDIRDVRSQKQVGDIQSKRRFQGQSDGVRDVKWSPTEGLDFAFATDAGEVQRWDMRNLKAAKMRVPAHSLACNTVDWHPDGKHIVTAGSDKTIRVFDVSGSRPKKASWEIKAPHPVMHVRWRPPCRSMMAHDHGAGICTQVVAYYDRDHPLLQVWDFRRPLLPFRELQPHPSAPTDMLWHSQDLLWTVGREGTLLQTDIQHTPKVIDRCNLQALDVSPLGELTFVTQSRKQRRVPQPTPSTEKQSKPKPSSLSTSPESAFLSRSWADDGVDHSFLSTLPSKRQTHVSSNSRFSNIAQPTRNQNISATIKLDDILGNRKSFRPQQIACRGQLPGINNRKHVAFMAERYAIEFKADPSDGGFLAVVNKALKDNEEYAASIGQLREAQTWKVVDHCVMKHLTDRAAFKRKRASEKGSPQIEGKQPTSIESLASRLAAQHLKSPVSSPRSMRAVSAITQQLVLPESTSNVPTPLARPSAGDRVPLPDLDAGERITLPPSLTSGLGKPSLHAPTPLSSSARRLTMDTLAEMQKNQTFQETAERSEMVKKWSAQAKGVLSLDPVDNQGVRIPLSKLENHGSGESFLFLEDSAGSREASFPASFESKSAGVPMVSAHPTRPRPSRAQTAESVAPAGSGETQQSLLFDGSGALADTAPPGRNTAQNASRNDIGDGVTDSTDFAHREQVSPEVLQRRFAAVNKKLAFDTATFGSELKTPQHKIARLAVETITGYASGSPTEGLPDEAEVDLEERAIWTLVDMLQKLVDYYSRDQPYPQMASVLLLLVGPLLPRTHPLSTPEIQQTVSSYVDYFINSLEWDPNDVPALIKQCFEQPMKAGLQPLQIESILLTYHEQLLRYQLFDEAAVLRTLCYPAYPAVYEDFLGDNSVYLSCGQCGKPVFANSTSLRCQGCKTKQEPCPICWMDRSPYETHSSTLHSCCLLCGHSGHAACLHEWFVVANGQGCPTAGCLCDCVAGPRRDEELAAAENEAHVKTHGRVKSDDWRARESKAVAGARDQLKK
ncbi:putative GATOR complex protein WDR24 [Septoria linicola]|nr:putative GATOR complex protein WDR24 [Septoria linicola]